MTEQSQSVKQLIELNSMKETNKILICVNKGCKTPQGPDGEYCKECYDKLYKIRVIFSQAYSGGARADVFIGEKMYVLELKELQDRLEKEILEKGYEVSQSKRQKYPRIIIN